MIDSIFLRECLILDTCCMTNLYASGHMQVILKSLPVPVVIASSVYQNPHIIYSCNDPDNNPGETTEDIDLHAMIASKCLSVVLTNCDIEEMAVNFARIGIIDNEEAITASIAAYYNWSFGTENRQSIALLTKQAPGVQLLSTADLIKYWIDTTHPPLPVIRTTLRNMRRRALYEPCLNQTHLPNF